MDALDILLWIKHGYNAETEELVKMAYLWKGILATWINGHESFSSFNNPNLPWNHFSYVTDCSAADHWGA